MKNYLTPLSILVGALFVGIAIIQSSKSEQYEYVKENVVFDKNSGKTYFIDQKQYVDIKGDRYQFD
ncbi:hypothetical protein N9I15_02025 [Flavobacteriaceae bacterium]|jgi:nitrogen fixation-related uncharacterized protein|nr:hypothetical protein [Flavobacteriaceae bacterium]MDA7808521.1 hypothetical protein [Flavobacteriaceae bacterium]MDA8644078.1 hypothetical protein [Flavobacteriaceae bacterium]MDA8877407.1 hypothetical protein [Flavobacteriaceae bacterium]MDA9037494.1 hypothetical protein [Flavobacteriaceae bacterium]